MANIIRNFLNSIAGKSTTQKATSANKGSSSREKNNIAELDKADTLLEEFEKLVSLWEANPRTFEPDTCTTLIQQLWYMIYASSVLTFTGSVGKWFEEPSAKEKIEYQQIKPLLDKWVVIPDGMDQQTFEDFKADLRAFSVDYPKWAGQEWRVIEWFENTVWKQVFQELFNRLTPVCQRVNIIMEHSTSKVHSMINTNYATISPFDFECVVSDLFARMGYISHNTKKTGDYGIDVVAKDSKDIIAIQVKKYMKGNNVGNRDIQMLLGAMQLNTVKANKAILITTSDFTIQAKEQAKGAPIELWNGEYFNSLMLKYML